MLFPSHVCFEEIVNIFTSHIYEMDCTGRKKQKRDQMSHCTSFRSGIIDIERCRLEGKDIYCACTMAISSFFDCFISP